MPRILSKGRIDADGRRSEPNFCLAPCCSVGEESFIQGSCNRDGGVRDILDIKHIDKMKGTPVSDAGNRSRILGEVVKAEHDVDNSGDYFVCDAAIAESVGCNELDDHNKHRKKKKSHKLIKSELLWDVKETESLGCNASHKHKTKKKSRKHDKSDIFPNSAEANHVDSSTLYTGHRKKETKQLETFFQSGILSDMTSSVLEDGSLDYNDLLSLVDRESRPQKKKCKTKSSRLDILYNVTESQQEMDTIGCNDFDLVELANASPSKNKSMTKSDTIPGEIDLDRETDGHHYKDMQTLSKSVSVHKTNTKSRRPDTLPDDEETDVRGRVDRDATVSPQKHKRKKKCRDLAQSEPQSKIKDNRTSDDYALEKLPQNAHKHQANKSKLDGRDNVSDIISWVLEADSQDDEQLCIPNSQSRNKNNTVEAYSSICGTDSHLQNVRATESKQKRAKRSAEFAKSDILTQESDRLDCNDSVSTVDSMSTHKRRRNKNKVKMTLSDQTGLVQESFVADFNDLSADLASCPRRKTKPTKLSPSGISFDVEETDSATCSTFVSYHKRKEKSVSFSQSEPLYTVGETNTDDCSMRPSEQVSIRTHKRKLAKADILDSTDLGQEADVLNDSQSLITSVSAKKKKKSRKLSKSDTSDGPDLSQEVDVVDYSQSQSLISPTSTHKNTKKSGKLAKADILDSTDLGQEADVLSDSQSLITSVSAKKKKKSRKLSKSDTSDSTDLFQEAGVVDYSQSQSLISPIKTTKKSKKQARFDILDGTNLARETNVFDRTLSASFPDSDLSLKSKKTSRKQTCSDDTLNIRRVFEVHSELWPDERQDASDSILYSELKLIEMLKDCSSNKETFADVLHTYEKNVSATRYRNTRQILQAEGLHVNMKKWSIFEDDQLRKNWNSFKQMYPEADAEQMLTGNYCDKREKTEIQTMIKSTNFYVQLGVNIRRHLCQIYKRARLILIQQPINDITESDQKLIVELHETHGNRWSLIGKSVGATARLVQYKMKYAKKPHCKGVWSKEEDDQLFEAIRLTTGDQYMEDDRSKLNWQMIAEYVPGRNVEQCYSHWFGVIKPKMELEKKMLLVPQKHGQRIKVISNRRLIDSVACVGVDSNDKINWTDVQELVDRNVPVSMLTDRWRRLCRLVPGYKNKSVADILDYLQRSSGSMISRALQHSYDEAMKNVVDSDDELTTTYSNDE